MYLLADYFLAVTFLHPPSLHPSLLHQPSSALSLPSIASFTSSLHPRHGLPLLFSSCCTHPVLSLGHLLPSIPLPCPNLINCRFCTLSVTFFPSPLFILSFHSVLHLVLSSCSTFVAPVVVTVQDLSEAQFKKYVTAAVTVTLSSDWAE
jgi:hypothetical protein